jgi:hypothetical protein
MMSRLVGRRGDPLAPLRFHDPTASPMARERSA